MIKPDFWTDGLMANLTPFQRLMYIGLWNYADDKGRFKADPRLIKGALFALDNTTTLMQIAGALTEYSRSRRVLFYRDLGSGEWYGFICKFLSHQVINRPSKYEYPPPPAQFTEYSVSTQGVFTDEEDMDMDMDVGVELKEKAPPPPKPTLASASLHGAGNNGKGSLEEKLYQAYPLHVAKGAALKAIKKALSRTTFEVLLAGVERYKNNPRRKPEYTKHPSTWFNQECWSDEEPAVSESNSAETPPFVELNGEQMAEVEAKWQIIAELKGRKPVVYSGSTSLEDEIRQRQYQKLKASGWTLEKEPDFVKRHGEFHD